MIVLLLLLFFFFEIEQFNAQNVISNKCFKHYSNKPLIELSVITVNRFQMHNTKHIDSVQCENHKYTVSVIYVIINTKLRL